jgi:hypothetical protein
LSESTKPTRSRGEEDVPDAGGVGGAGGGICDPEGAVTQRRFDAAPFAAGGDALVQLPFRLARAWPVAPFLVKHGPATQDPHSSAPTVGSHGLLDYPYAFEDKRDEHLASKVPESVGPRERKRNHLGHGPLFVAEEMLGPRSCQGFVTGDCIERGNARPVVSFLHQTVLASRRR